MGFFTDLKEDLSQAVNELLPEDKVDSNSSEEVSELTSQEEMQPEVQEMISQEEAQPEVQEMISQEEIQPEVQEIISQEEIQPEVQEVMEEAADVSPAAPTDLASMLEQIELEETKAMEMEQAANNAAVMAEEAPEEVSMEEELEAVEEEEASAAAIEEPMEAAVSAPALEEQVTEKFEDYMEELIKEEKAEQPEKEEEMTMDESVYVAPTPEKSWSETTAQTKDVSDETAVITAGMTINGNITSEGSVELSGTVNGDIEILGKLNVTGHIRGNSQSSEIYADNARIEGEVRSIGSVKIGQGSVIIGNIFATSAVIAGAVKGDIDVQGPVVVDSSAIVLGNIKSKAVQINNGAVIEGNCSQAYAEVNPTSFFDEFKKNKK